MVLILAEAACSSRGHHPHGPQELFIYPPLRGHLGHQEEDLALVGRRAPAEELPFPLLRVMCYPQFVHTAVLFFPNPRELIDPPS